MNTTTVYHSLALQHESLMKEITERVIKATAIQRLYLLGLTTAHHCTESLFAAPSDSRAEVTHGYLLAVVDKEEGQGLNGVQDKLEAHLQWLLPATVIVLSAASFCRWLLEGHPFACSVGEKGYLLYQKEELPLPQAATVNEEAVQKESEQLFLQTEIKVREFLAGAELYTVRVQYGLAAFLLHQAAEQALRTMLVIHTGLRLNTHSIDRLVRCCTLFCYDLPTVFPRMSEKDKRLFGLLQRAYIDTRYTESYRIRLEEVKVLTEKVKRLQEILERFRP